MATNPPPEPRYRADGALLCHAKKGTCKAPAMRGQRVCQAHGGSAPGAKRAAALRLAALVDPAITTLDKVMRSEDARDQDKLRAADSVLDRAGYARSTKVEQADVKALLSERIEAIRARRAEAHREAFDALDEALDQLEP